MLETAETYYTLREKSTYARCLVPRAGGSGNILRCQAIRAACSGSQAISKEEKVVLIILLASWGLALRLSQIVSDPCLEERVPLSPKLLSAKGQEF